MFYCSQSTLTSSPTFTSISPLSGAHIRVTIGGAPWQTHSISSEQGLVTSYSNLNKGPVKIENTNGNPMVGSESVIYSVGHLPLSFSEMMALPDSQLDQIYWLPWYNNVNLDMQIRFA
jgi:hypothetical protein